MKKFYIDWVNSSKPLSQFLEIGDSVCDDIINYVLEVLPPHTWTNSIIQMGEPYSHNKRGYPLYITFEKTGFDWIYTGIKPTPRYKVYKIMNKSGRKTLIQKNLTLTEAKRLVNSFPDSQKSMVIFTKSN